MTDLTSRGGTSGVTAVSITRAPDSLSNSSPDAATSPPCPPYGTRYVVWIEDADGHFVKTLYQTFVVDFCRSFTSLSLTWPTWAANSNQETDGNTGATPNYSTTNQTYTYNWDMRNGSGQPVSNGTYRFNVEVSGYWYNPQVSEVSTGSILIDGTPHLAAGTPGGPRIVNLQANYVP